MYIYIYTYVFILKLLGLTFASIYTYVSIICFHLIYDSQKKLALNLRPLSFEMSMSSESFPGRFS